MTSHDHHGIELSFIIRSVTISGCFVVIKILFF